MRLSFFCGLVVGALACTGEVHEPDDAENEAATSTSTSTATAAGASGAGGEGAIDAIATASSGTTANGAGGSVPDACAQVPDGWWCDPTSIPASRHRCEGGLTAEREACEYGCTERAQELAACSPRGRGVWIWRFDQSAPSAPDVAAQAEALNVGFVLIKSGEDESVWEDNFNPSIVAEFTSRGMWVFGWNYVRPGNVEAKADRIAAQANIAGVRGMVLDVEIEWEESATAARDAVLLCNAIRGKAPGKSLGFSSFGWILAHPSFPYSEFDAHCGDMHLPQTYWDAWGGISRLDGYQKAVEGRDALGLTAPLWAAQDNYEGSPTTSELNSFFAVAGPQANLWRWPNPLDDDLREQMNELAWENDF